MTAEQNKMKPDDIKRIERELAVALPSELREFLVSARDQFDPDDVAVFDEPDAIIEATKEHRAGVGKLPAWPASWVYLGDESDACPRYVDCATGRIVSLDKGNLNRKPLESYETFGAYREKARQEEKNVQEAEKVPSTWKGTVRFYTPVAIALFAFFVVLPLCGLAVMTLFKWLFK